MLWDAAYGYNGGVRLTDSVQIDAVLDQAIEQNSRCLYNDFPGPVP